MPWLLSPSSPPQRTSTPAHRPPNKTTCGGGESGAQGGNRTTEHRILNGAAGGRVSQAAWRTRICAGARCAGGCRRATACLLSCKRGALLPLFIWVPYRCIMICKVFHARLRHFCGCQIIRVFRQLCSVCHGMASPTKGDEVMRVRVCATLRARYCVMDLQTAHTIADGAAVAVSAVDGLAD